MAKRKKKNEGGIWGSVTDKDWADTFQDDERRPRRKKKPPKAPKKGRRKKDDNWGW